MNWCLYRLEPEPGRVPAGAIETPLLGIINVPEGKTYGEVLDALLLAGQRVEPDVFLDDESSWSPTIHRLWPSLTRKIDWNRLALTRRSGGSL